MKDYQSRQAIHELGGIPPLLELLKSEFPVIQHLALKTLHSVTTDKDTRETFREEQGFEKLVDILSNAVGVYVCVSNTPMCIFIPTQILHPFPPILSIYFCRT